MQIYQNKRYIDTIIEEQIKKYIDRLRVQEHTIHNNKK